MPIIFPLFSDFSQFIIRVVLLLSCGKLNWIINEVFGEKKLVLINLRLKILFESCSKRHILYSIFFPITLW